MPEGEFATALVRFKVTGEGAMEVEYEVGAETPEDRFRFNFTSLPCPAEISNFHSDTLQELYLNSIDDTWHLEVTEGPGREIDIPDTSTSDPRILDTSDLQVEVTGARGGCEYCQGEGQGVIGDRDVTCSACGGTGQESAVLGSTDPPGEEPGW